MEPQTGYLLFVRGSGWIGEEIDKITHSTYAHVAIFTEKSRILEAQRFRRIGFQNPEIYRGNADLYRVNGGASLLLLNRVIYNAEEHIGEWYDYPLLVVEAIRFLTGIVLPWYEFHSRICSTLIADAFREEGIDPTPDIPYPAPGDLAKSNLFEKVGAF